MKKMTEEMKKEIMKRAEEIAQKSITKDKFMSGFQACFEYLQRWISVEEDLPQESDQEQLLLVRRVSGRIELVYYYRNHMFMNYYFMKIDNVTHWRYMEYKQ
jgi:hypothetical protein